MIIDNEKFEYKKFNKIYCFGAGAIGKDFCDFLFRIGCDLHKVIFVDNNDKLQGDTKRIEGVNIPIISKNSMLK